MGISFRDFMESDSDSSFQVFVRSIDETIALLETLFRFDNYRDDIYMLESAKHRSQYPMQIFFRYEGMLNGVKHYENEGYMFARSLEESYLSRYYKPYTFREVMEYYCEPQFDNNSGDGLNNDVEYNISDLMEV